MIQATNLIDAAESWIDKRVASPWLEGAVSNEEHGANGEYIQARKYPVGSFTTVQARIGFGETYTALVEGTDWEIIDLPHGWIRIPKWASYERFRISYTPSSGAGVLPKEIELAASMLIARWLAPVLETVGGIGVDPNQIKSYSVGGELSVTFADGSGSSSTSKSGISGHTTPEDLIDPYAKGFDFA